MKYFLLRLVVAAVLALSTEKVAAEASFFLEDYEVFDHDDDYKTKQESHHMLELAT